MSTMIVKFICLDWVFLIYNCIFVIWTIFDIVTLIVGAVDGASCGAAIGNIVSACIHLLLRFWLCCTFCCLISQIQLSENPVCSPILWILTRGIVDANKIRKQRALSKAQRIRKENEEGGAGNAGIQQQPYANTGKPN